VSEGKSVNQIIETTPELSRSVAAIEEQLLPELTRYHDIDSPLFQRREQREQREK
jgi:hypothetical protein